MSIVFIYTLDCPLTGDVRYVGKTISPQKRMREHLKDAGKTFKANWIRSLKRLGFQPAMTVIDECSADDWREAETFYISYLRFLGCRLTNISKGGEPG